MRVLGLTGGIACGKSTVSGLLVQDGLEVVDCDAITHSIQRVGSPVLDDIFERWPQVRNNDGSLDRDALGAIIFHDPQERKALNAMMRWPLFVAITFHLADAWRRTPCARVVVFDVPLLFETGVFLPLCDSVAVVAASPAVQIQRLVERDASRRGRGPEAVASAEARVASQLPLQVKARRADFVIQNDDSLEALQTRVAAVAASAVRVPLLRRLRSRLALVVYIAAASVIYGCMRVRRAFRRYFRWFSRVRNE